MTQEGVRAATGTVSELRARGHKEFSGVVWVVWEVSDRLRNKRLQPFLSDAIYIFWDRGGLSFIPEMAKQMLLPTECAHR